jgi:hypothetical protein
VIDLERFDLMAALKRSLAEEISATSATMTKQRQAKPAGDGRQRPLLLPVAGDQKKKEEPETDPAAAERYPDVPSDQIEC